ncbi:MAG: hypothetical protein ACYSTI_13475 [Planctomycetota bacterium]
MFASFFRRLLPIFCTLVLLAPLSCTNGNPEEEAIKVLVGKYNVAIITAYKDLNTWPLKLVTTDAVFKKVNVMIESYLDGEQVMEAELLSLEFKDIKIEPESATVRTTEEWEYRWVDINSREVIDPTRPIHYEVLYHIIKSEDRWLVEKVEAKSDDSGLQEDLRYFCCVFLSAS